MNPSVMKKNKIPLSYALIMLLMIIVRVNGRSVGMGSIRRCREDLHGQCMPWSHHRKCPTIRQLARGSSGCGTNHFCCARPLRPQVESRQTTHWYDVCGINTPLSYAAPHVPNITRNALKNPGAALHSAYVIGGEPASQGLLPWQASIVVDGEHTCGGTLIDDKFVLTAAHCLGDESSTYEIIIGSLQMHGGDDHAVHVGVRSVHPHPGFHNYDNDIALIRLARSVATEINDHASVMPVCPPRYEVDYTGKMGYVAGWGKTRYPVGIKSETLMYADVPIIDRDTCCSYHCPDNCNGLLCKVHEYNICAGYEAGGKDACAGDSGGPMVVNMGTLTSKYELVGVVSWGNKCAMEMSPGVYIDVRFFLPWIDDVRMDNA